jgi:hypothetical protein
MRTQRRTNFVWGLVLLALALAVVLHAAQVIPNGIYDLIARAWPALLVLAGLSIFLRPRITLGSGIALILSVVLVGVIVPLAFSTRAEQQREDNREALQQSISPNITLLRLQLTTLTTDLELLPTLNTDRSVIGEFIGSTESSVEISYSEEGTSATLSVEEKQASQFPLLENVGRGALRLELPSDLALDVELLGSNGTIRLNMSGLAVERLNLDLQQGNAIVTLPAYKPLGTPPTESLGTLAVRNGEITLFIPQEVSARLELNRSGSGIDPVYDSNAYNYLVGDVLEARTIETADIVVRYTITAPRGRIRVEVPEPGG